MIGKIISGKLSDNNNFPYIKIINNGIIYRCYQNNLINISFENLDLNDEVNFNPFEKYNGYFIAKKVSLSKKADPIEGMIIKLSTDEDKIPFGNISTGNKTYNFKEQHIKGKSITDLYEGDIVSFKITSENNYANNVTYIKKADLEEQKKYIKQTRKIDEYFKKNIFNLMKTEFQNGTKVKLSELGTLLHDNKIYYKEYGYEKLNEFCKNISFLQLFTSNEDNQTYVNIQEYIMNSSINIPQSASELSSNKDSLITEDICKEIYIYLRSKFDRGQYPFASIIRALEEKNYKAKNYNIINNYEFLKRFFEFLSLDEPYEKKFKKYSTNVTINIIPKWENEIIKDKNNEMQLFNNNTTPGINKDVNLNNLNNDERMVISIFQKHFFITYVSTYNNENSNYNYCFLKPTSFFNEKFNIHDEILLIFDNNEEFHIKSIETIEKILCDPSLIYISHLDRIVQIIISNDKSINEKIKEIRINKNYEGNVIIPFSYAEFNKQTEHNYQNILWERFETFFSAIDLFAFETALKEDRYFLVVNHFYYILKIDQNQDKIQGYLVFDAVEKHQYFMLCREF